MADFKPTGLIDIAAMSGLGDYKVHPAAAAFPMLGDAEMAKLGEDIAENGLIEPIVLSNDGTTIIDGRNRYRACMKARIDPLFRKLGSHYTESDIIGFIISKNLMRRDLEKGQRAMIMLSLAPMLAEAAKERQRGGQGGKLLPPKSEGARGEVAEQIAAMASVAASTVHQAKKVSGTSPALAAAVVAGTITLNDAYKQVRDKEKTEEPAAKEGRAGQVMLTLRTHDGTAVPYRQPLSKPTFNRTNDHISWAKWSWNPVTGCLHGCPYCYARELAMRPSYAEAYPVGFTPLFHVERLAAPANTTVPDAADRDSRERRVFVCSMADLYGKWVPQEWIDQVHQTCIKNPQWEYLMLTKFPRRYVGLDLPATAWLGTSVDEQKRVRLAEEAFRQISGVRVKWLSLEPLLAPLEFTDLSMFDWIVIGAQSATEQPDGLVPEYAPPFEWVARLVDQAREARCRVYLKPNLLGGTPTPQAPGMKLPQEEPEFSRRDLGG